MAAVEFSTRSTSSSATTPKRALPLLDQGASRDEILARPARVLGAHGASASPSSAARSAC